MSKLLHTMMSPIGSEREVSTVYEATMIISFEHSHSNNSPPIRSTTNFEPVQCSAPTTVDLLRVGQYYWCNERKNICSSSSIQYKRPKDTELWYSFARTCRHNRIRVYAHQPNIYRKSVTNTFPLSEGNRNEIGDLSIKRFLAGRNDRYIGEAENK